MKALMKLYKNKKIILGLLVNFIVKKHRFMYSNYFFNLNLRRFGKNLIFFSPFFSFK